MYWKYPWFVEMKPTVIQKESTKHQLPKWFLLWVLAIPTNFNKETSKFYLSIVLTVGIEFMTTEIQNEVQITVQLSQIYKVR